MIMIQPVDVAYFKTLYFWVTTAVVIVLVIVWNKKWYEWERKDEIRRRGFIGLD